MKNLIQLIIISCLLINVSCSSGEKLDIRNIESCKSFIVHNLFYNDAQKTTLKFQEDESLEGITNEKHNFSANWDLGELHNDTSRVLEIKNIIFSNSQEGGKTKVLITKSGDLIDFFNPSIVYLSSNKNIQNDNEIKNVSKDSLAKAKAQLKEMQEKADHNDAWIAIEDLQNQNRSDALFSGTKKFCDSDGSWMCKVTVENPKVTIKIFPGINNSYHKDKSQPTKIINGFIVKDNVIASKDEEGQWKQLYWYKNKIWYAAAYEDTEHSYTECSQ